MYWVSSITATLIFLLFMATLLMVPGVLPVTEVWMLSVAGGVAFVSLGIGTWRFGTTEAPIMSGRAAAVVGVVLLLELAECSLSVLKLAAKMHR
jgi:hypothetical protein